MNSKFFTNRQENTLFSKLEGVFEHNKAINNFDVLVGYFRSSGYFKLRPLLDNIDNIRILVGIDVDKIAKDMQQLGLALFVGDDEKTIKDWEEAFVEDIKKADYEPLIEQGILQFITDIQTEKVKLRAHPSKNIHAKIYIFRPDDFNPHKAGNVITGSSNLSNAGLGTTASSNYEFNVLLNDYDDIQFATAEFEQLWLEGVPILPESAQKSLKETHLADDISPYELYLKCLIEYFGDEIEFDPNSIKDLPSGFKRLSYQLDAVNEGWQMLKKHNGFFLSDVVGLGKTVIATLIVKQFLFSKKRGYNPNILLIVPPALKPNWEDTLKKFEIRAKVEIFTNGSLHNIHSPEDYDMVIVDEAHKFRNHTAQSYDQLQRICKTKTKTKTNANANANANADEDEDEDKKVILISATPLNNRPDDLYNQILLFQDGNDSTLDFPLARFFTKANQQYRRILKLADKKIAAQETKQLYEKIREKVITPLMVRRTRTDLLDNPRYQKDLKEQNIVFSKTTPPQPVYYQLESTLEDLYDQTLQKIDNKKQDNSGLLHSRYRALHYLKPEFKNKYKRADFIAERLVALMKTLLLKRMDSSFYAFKQTLQHFIKSSEVMLKMIANNEIIIAPNRNISEYILEDREDELIDLLARESLTDPSIVIVTKDDFEPGFITGIEHDYAMLKELKSAWDGITIDPKIDQLLAQLPDFLAAENNPEQKIIIFTESTDTVNYLSKKMASTDYKDKTLTVNAGNREQLKQKISQNFDANIEPEHKKNDYQIILTTDVLAEGVNLHRANTVINYDTPWNATKLMQRIGRVNRIGQVASYIFVYNFYPTAQINNDIKLEKKALIKLQAFHSALGEDSQIYSTDEEVHNFGIFDQDIQEEKNEVIPFLEEIREFKKNHEEDYKRIEDLPSKLRNAVKNADHTNGTVVFARTADNRSSRFYMVGDKVVSYSFIQTAKLLKCPQNTKTQALHSRHHEQVRSALTNFKDEIEQDILDQTQNIALSNNERKAINFLKSIKSLPQANPQEQTKLEQAITQIKNKQFQGLVKDIVKLSKNINGIKPIVILEHTLNIIKKYDVNTHIENAQVKPKKVHDSEPVVVISQSYV